MAEKQIKSRKRVADHGEVFTGEREVNAMLDLVKDESERIDSRFLDPDGGIVGFLNDAAIFTDVDRVKNTRFINRNLIYTKNFTLSAVGIAIEYHIAA